MLHTLSEGFYRLVLRHWVWVVAAVLLVLAGAAYESRHFELDASAQSLMLENDQDLETYRAVRARYGSDDFVFVTYTPTKPLFGDAALGTIGSLRDDIAALDRVDSVMSVLDVPLIQGPDMSFSKLQEDIPTLGDDDVDRDRARRELQTSPLYKDLLLNRDADTTMLVVRFDNDERFGELQQRRRELRQKREAGELDAGGRAELRQVEHAYDQRSDHLQALMERDIGRIRDILDGYRNPATIHLGGVPMIAVDMIDFVRSDIRTFGVAVGLFIIVLLGFAFRRTRWVLVPTAICASVVVAMVGWIGWMGWPVTVVSSNFISLVLIITLSLIVHLIVRHRELQAESPQLDQRELVRATIASKFKPSFFTSLTTLVSFASLMFADIKPVKDFGLMMTCAVVIGFVLTFILFPALVAPLKRGHLPELQRDFTRRFNLGLVRGVRRRPGLTGLVFVALFVVGVTGALRLSVENRFIDYFHDDTEIYQGMKLIDQELGGTTPLDVVLDAPQSFVEDYKADKEFAAEMGLSSEDNPAEGYWYNAHSLERITRIHDYLASFDATGKILSMGTVWKMARRLNDGEALEPYELAILYKRVPQELREQLIDPYMSEDGLQVRFDIRVIDSLPGLQRDELLHRIRSGLQERFDLAPEQVTLSGMLVLYNNVMQSLFRSQIVTLAVVFVAIMLMFGLLYRSLRMALIGPIPTVVAASLVLGIMGWIGLPLDIMTMTIAAIVIGIGVDDTIHYVDRFQSEVRAGVGYARAAEAAHGEVGRAMVYTTVIITLGFSILTLSNFMPTIYFGLLTGLAMVFALLSNLALLPVLLERVRPFGRG